MNHIQGLDRQQMVLFPEAIEDYVAADNPIRFLEAFVENLSLIELGFQSVILQQTGRPPYHPADLLKLYLYGYLHKIRSSRKLESESKRNVELMWLMKKLSPDFKTIASFRNDNRDALVKLCREFTLLCKDLNLFSGELVAIDGSKFKAVNASDKNVTVRMLKKKISEIDQRIKRYLNDMDHHDRDDGGTHDLTAEELQKKIDSLKQRRDTYEELHDDMEENSEMQRSLTDPDSRSMMFRKGCDVGYNVQSAVDSKHHLIVHHEVTNHPTDQNEILPVAKQAKKILQVESLNVVADMGYYNGDQVKQCEDENILVYTEKPNTSANRKLGLFPKDAFRYFPENDVYVCPAKQELHYRSTIDEGGRLTRYYVTSACRKCPLKSKCTRGKERRITRWIHEDVLDRMRERVRKWPGIMKLRRELVEHPFGTMKRWMDQGYFLMKGLPNVKAEMALTVFSYNLKRAMQILGVQRLVAAVS